MNCLGCRDMVKNGATETVSGKMANAGQEEAWEETLVSQDHQEAWE